MKVLVRADASTEIGTGHVARCLTLAKALSARGHSVCLLSREHTGHLLEFVRSQGVEAIGLPGAEADMAGSKGYARWLGVSQAEDARETLAILDGMGPVAWIVVDHYGIDAEWERLLRSAGPRILAIDDLAGRSHVCDLLLDQNRPECSDAYRQLCANYCQTLLGPRYALLRDEFRAAHSRAKVRHGAVSRIFVFYGGIDATNDTAKAVRALAAVMPDLPVDVVVGRDNPHQQALKTLASRLPMMVLHEGSTRMAELMSQADLALGAGGTTTWERAAVGLPVLATAIADNQVFIGQQIENLGLGRYLGSSAEVDDTTVAHALQDVLHQPGCLRSWSEAALSMADGLGPVRVVQRMEGWAGESREVLP